MSGQALRQAVEDGPIPAVHGVVRWRLIDLARWLLEEFRLVKRGLAAMGVYLGGLR